jgi:hypothetical protein
LGGCESFCGFFDEFAAFRDRTTVVTHCVGLSSRSRCLRVD